MSTIGSSPQGVIPTSRHIAGNLADCGTVVPHGPADESGAYSSPRPL